LAALPPDGFDIVCFPVKVHRASAGWTRAVAIFNDPGPVDRGLSGGSVI
jgi:hypothetical protein